MEQSLKFQKTITINGRSYTESEVKALVAEAAQLHSENRIQDQKLIEYFSEREEAWSKAKALKEEFQVFQKKYMDEIRQYSEDTTKLQGIIENSEAKILKRLLELKA